MIKNWIISKFLNGTYSLKKSNYAITKIRNGYCVVNRPKVGISLIIKEFNDEDKEYALNEAKELLYYLEKDI